MEKAFPDMVTDLNGKNVMVTGRYSGKHQDDKVRRYKFPFWRVAEEPDEPPYRVLDIGTGKGTVLPGILDSVKVNSNIEVYGIDLNYDVLKASWRGHPIHDENLSKYSDFTQVDEELDHGMGCRMEIPDNVHMISADGEALPFPDDFFNLVVSHDVKMYIQEFQGSWGDVVNEAERVAINDDKRRVWLDETPGRWWNWDSVEAKEGVDVYEVFSEPRYNY